MKTRFKTNNKGFSLVELMVVVSIIGILSAVAIPRFNSFRAKAIRAEANSSLANINTLQQLYYADQSVYTTTLADIGFTPNASAKYGYTATIGTGTYTATAESAAPLCAAAGTTNDEVEVNETGAVSVATDGLSAC